MSSTMSHIHSENKIAKYGCVIFYTLNASFFMYDCDWHCSYFKSKLVNIFVVVFACLILNWESKRIYVRLNFRKKYFACEIWMKEIVLWNWFERLRERFPIMYAPVIVLCFKHQFCNVMSMFRDNLFCCIPPWNT